MDYDGQIEYQVEQLRQQAEAVYQAVREVPVAKQFPGLPIPDEHSPFKNMPAPQFADQFMSSLDDIHPDDIFFKEDVHDYIKDEHKIMLVLLNAQYLRCRLEEYEGWKLICTTEELGWKELPPAFQKDKNTELSATGDYRINNEHACLYKRGDEYLICCRGTQIGRTGGFQDILDDVLIGFGFVNLINFLAGTAVGFGLDLGKTLLKSGFKAESANLVRLAVGEEGIGEFIGKNAAEKGPNYVAKVSGLASAWERINVGCELVARHAAAAIIEGLLSKGVSESRIRVCGHSLGGRAAGCVAAEFGLAECVVFNMASPMTNPFEVPVSEQRMTHYHICGDLISSHTGNIGMTTIRKCIELRPVKGTIKTESSSYGSSLYNTKEPDSWSIGPTKNPLFWSIWDKLEKVRIKSLPRFDFLVHHSLRNFTKAVPHLPANIGTSEYDTMLYFWSGDCDWGQLYFGQSSGVKSEIGAEGFFYLGTLFQAVTQHVCWQNPIIGSSRWYFKQQLHTCGGGEDFGMKDISLWERWQWWFACSADYVENLVEDLAFGAASAAILPALYAAAAANPYIWVTLIMSFAVGVISAQVHTVKQYYKY